MSWRDALRLAMRSLARRLGRTVLTVTAVALGSALLTGLLTIVGTARSRVLEQLTAGGPLASIKVALPPENAPAGESEPGSASRGRRSAQDPEVDDARARLDEAAAERIAQVPGVGTVLRVVTAPIMVVPPDPPFRKVGSDPATGKGAGKQSAAPVRVRQAGRADGPSGAVQPAAQSAHRTISPFGNTLIGLDLSRVGELPVLVVAGRLPQPGSFTEVAVTEGYLEQVGVERQRGQTVLGTELVIGAPRAFGDGSRARLRGRWTRVEIVGVVAQDAEAGQVLAPIEHARLARAWTASGAESGRFGVNASDYDVLLVVARGLDHVGDVRSRIETLGYSTSAPENLIATVLRYLGLVQLVLGGIGVLALAIAALGIANALFAAVRERRREIGVLKAIGARDRDVRRLFLLEAGAVGVLGGALGTAIGYGVARVVGSMVNGYLESQGVPGVAVTMATSVLVFGIVGSGALALLAGLAPARRAAKLPPWDAMGEV